MKYLSRLFANNRAWAESITRHDPEFFSRLAAIQTPEYLWIGCSDSRVSANQITGLLPGEVFVHRNVGNIVAADDLNCGSVIQFAVDILKIRHIIVCGHYGCGGVRAALRGECLGLVDKWLANIWEIRDRHAELLSPLASDEDRWKLLCELNVIEQVRNVGLTPAVRDAWSRGQELYIHGWIYGLRDGFLRDLEITVRRPEELDSVYTQALTRLAP
ncbi:MAG: carbonate dehydratase [Candidatus Zixiibacteriota bacterium]